MSKMLPGLYEANPSEAVVIGQAALSRGRDDAWGQVDKALINYILRYLLDQKGDPDVLGLGMVDALDWSRDAREAAWTARWGGYLEIIEEARERPSSAKALALVMPRGKEVKLLELLYGSGAPLRPQHILEELDMQASAVSRHLKNLQGSGLIYRQRTGRAVWVILTKRGRELSKLLKLSPAAANDNPSDPRRTPYWPYSEVTRCLAL